MQITLVQTELETALREYIGRQLTVSEGMEMFIELRAGRGTDGFTATIDIKPKKGSTQSSPIPEASSASSSSTKAMASTNGAHVRSAPIDGEAVEEHREPEAPAAQDPAPFDTDEQPVQAQDPAPALVQAVAEPDPAPVQQPVEQPVQQDAASAPVNPETGKRSLFRGVKKPVNAPATH